MIESIPHLPVRRAARASSEHVLFAAATEALWLRALAADAF